MGAVGGAASEAIPREVEPPPLAPEALAHVGRCVFHPPDPGPADLLFVFGTVQARFDGVAHAWRERRYPRLVLAGGAGPGWEHYGVPIARGMRYELLALGVPPDAIVVQDHSHNTLEDVAFSLRHLGSGALAPRRLAFAAKPHHSGRCHLTLRRFFPDTLLRFEPLASTAGGIDLDAASWTATRTGRARVYAEYLRIVAYSARGDIASPTMISSSDASPGTPTRSGNP